MQIATIWAACGNNWLDALQNAEQKHGDIKVIVLNVSDSRLKEAFKAPEITATVEQSHENK
jgi:hypothetical protein